MTQDDGLPEAIPIEEAAEILAMHLDTVPLGGFVTVSPASKVVRDQAVLG
jgi:hypothetical protein